MGYPVVAPSALVVIYQRFNLSNLKHHLNQVLGPRF